MRWCSFQNWVSYGFETTDPHLDSFAHHVTMFFMVTICLCWGAFILAYQPDHKWVELCVCMCLPVCVYNSVLFVFDVLKRQENKHWRERERERESVCVCVREQAYMCGYMQCCMCGIDVKRV